MEDNPDIRVRRADDGSAYEVSIDGEVVGRAFVREQGDAVVFTHTEVDETYEGQGVGSRLVREALDDVRARGRSVVAQCPFVADWIDRHPDYQDLTA